VADFSIRQEQTYLELFPTAYPLSLISVLSPIYTYRSLSFHSTLTSQDKTLKDNTGSGVVEVLSANTTINVAVPDALIGSIFGKQVQNLLPSSSHLALSLETHLYRFTQYFPISTTSHFLTAFHCRSSFYPMISRQPCTKLFSCRTHTWSSLPGNFNSNASLCVALSPHLL
jgi:hypothetical protein